MLVPPDATFYQNIFELEYYWLSCSVRLQHGARLGLFSLQRHEVLKDLERNLAIPRDGFAFA